MEKMVNRDTKIYDRKFREYLSLYIKQDLYAIIYADCEGVCAVKLNDEIKDGKVPLYEFKVKQLKNGSCLGFVEVE